MCSKTALKHALGHWGVLTTDDKMILALKADQAVVRGDDASDPASFAYPDSDGYSDLGDANVVEETTPNAMASALKDKPAKPSDSPSPAVSPEESADMFDAAVPKEDPPKVAPIDIKKAIEDQFAKMGSEAPTEEQTVSYLRDRLNWISGGDVEELSAAKRTQIINGIDRFVEKVKKYATENGAPDVK
jgi:hypothetical protein